MRCVLLGVVVVTACGGGGATAPDGPTEVPAVTPACEMLSLPSHQYLHGSDLSPAVAGTLASWDPNGRWFLTGVQTGSVSSFLFSTATGALVVDRNASFPATLDDTELFQRYAYQFDGASYIVVKRVSNRRVDPETGAETFRAERVTCEGDACTACTAELMRATHATTDGAVEGEGSGLALLGQLNDPTWGDGYTFNVRMVGTRAYLIRQDGLHVIETADPAHPVELGKWRRSGDGYSNDVKLVAAGGREYALIADTPVDIVDVTDPHAMTLVANIPEGAHTLAVEQRGGKQYAYFGNYDATCPVYDVTDPAHPAKLGSFGSSGILVHDLSVVDGVAYLNAWDEGFVVVDFSDPANPVQRGKWGPTPTHTSHSNWTTTVGGRHIALHGEENYGAHLHVVDVDPASPTYMQPFAEWKTRDWISIHNIMAFGAKAYVSYYQDGIRVLDVADPAAPRQLGYYNTWEPDAAYTSGEFFEGAVGLDVDPARKLVFVADSPRGLLILRDDTP